MRITAVAALGLSLGVAAPAALRAADVTVPKGTFLELKTDSAFSSDTAKVGETFTAKVTRGVAVEGVVAIPAGSIVVGEIKHVRTPADGAKSAVVGVKFETLKTGGKSYDLEGVLVSLKADERRKMLEQRGKLTTGRKIDVVLIGAGTEADMRADTLVGISGTDTNELADDWAKSGLGPAHVRVAAGTNLIMQLDEDLAVRGAGTADANVRNLFTASDTLKSVQEALRAKNYYTGPATGTLDQVTREAIARFQLDQGQPATGDAEERTVQALGVTVPMARVRQPR